VHCVDEWAIDERPFRPDVARTGSIHRLAHAGWITVEQDSARNARRERPNRHDGIVVEAVYRALGFGAGKRVDH
jgi:hypothetical protein